MKQINPVVGDWYKRVGGGLFEVVAHDEEDGTIEVQHYDGTVEEYEAEAWADMPIETVEPPEDWSGSLDMEREDYGVDREDPNAVWNNRINEFIDTVD